MPNRLSRESSPYLLEHAHDRVDWHPWGEEAFERARSEDKPVFVSIGYAACHTCRVMAREAFAKERRPRRLNEHFIPVLVDRQERPDVDAVHMNAVHTLTGAGGWPLTLFLTPDGAPFHGATYLPPTDRSGFAGLERVLGEIASVWSQRRDDATAAAAQVAAQLRKACGVDPPGREDTELSRNILALAFRRTAAAFDGEWGGFGPAPKFPQPTLLSFLLRYHAATGEPHALDMVETTLEHMARGGICDQLGGGFHRYATDARWLLPRFEKMLSDNVLLAGVYLDAFFRTRKPLYERIARETLDYVLRDLADAEGGFHAGQDADTDGREGAFYLWTAEEVRAVVGAKDAAVVLRHFGVGPIGNFESAESVLSVAAAPEEIAAQTGRDRAAVEAAIAGGRRALFEIRAERAAAAVDETIVTAWNGLAISALARGGAALRERRYLEAARRCAGFLLARMCPHDGGLWRCHRNGESRIPGFLPDYAFLISGLLDLHEASPEGRWLDEAAARADAMIERFWDHAEGGFFFTEREERYLPARLKDTLDDPAPAGNAAATVALLRLAEATGRDAWGQKAARTLRLTAPTMIRSPLHAATMLAALDRYTAPPVTRHVAGGAS